MKLTGNNSRPTTNSALSHSLPKRDVRVTSVNPSISDMILQRRERRNGPNSDINSCVRSMPRDETSVGLIAQQRLIKQLGYEIIEEEK